MAKPDATLARLYYVFRLQNFKRLVSIRFHRLFLRRRFVDMKSDPFSPPRAGQGGGLAEQMKLGSMATGRDVIDRGVLDAQLKQKSGTQGWLAVL